MNIKSAKLRLPTLILENVFLPILIAVAFLLIFAHFEFKDSVWSFFESWSKNRHSLTRRFIGMLSSSSLKMLFNSTYPLVMLLELNLDALWVRVLFKFDVVILLIVPLSDKPSTTSTLEIALRRVRGTGACTYNLSLGKIAFRLRDLLKTTQMASIEIYR